MENKKIEEKSKLDLMVEMIGYGAKLFNKDRGKGKLLKNVFNKLYETDKELADKIYKELMAIDKRVMLRGNFAQKVIFNKYLILKILNKFSIKKPEHHETDLLALIRYDIDDSEWLTLMIKHVLPTMINAKLI